MVNNEQVIPEHIPDLPQEVYDKGWTRDDIEYPSYKDFLRTAEPDKIYDFYADFLIEGERHTYFLRRTTIDDILSKYTDYMTDLEGRVIDMANESGEEIGIIPTIKLDFVWRAINPIEGVKGTEE